MQIGVRLESQKKDFTIDFENLVCPDEMCLNFNDYLNIMSDYIPI